MGSRSGRGCRSPSSRPRSTWPTWPSAATVVSVSASYSIGEAKTQLSKLVRMAEDGEEVVLRRGQHPVARLVAIGPDEGRIKRQPGRMAGRVHVPDDFDEWPEDVARDLGIAE
jgi:antitoxin (DNA-binding transcriptional repressor) of toxin-antitoxin stability system